MASAPFSCTSHVNTYASYTLDHHGLVAGMVDELGLVEKIDAMIPQDLDQRQVSVGMAVKAMILMGLGFVQRALYLTPHFFKGKPVERLLGPGLTAEQLNDDALGRALDAIYAFGIEALSRGMSSNSRPAWAYNTWSPTAPCTARSPCGSWATRFGAAESRRPSPPRAKSSRRWRTIWRPAARTRLIAPSASSRPASGSAGWSSRPQPCGSATRRSDSAKAASETG